MSKGKLEKATNVVAVTVLSAALTACGGGGGGGGVASTPPPPTTVPPPPPPPPPPTGLEAPALLQSPPSGALATIGLEAAGGTSSALKSSGFAVSYDAAKQLYLMDFPSTKADYFYSFGSGNDRYWNGTLANDQQNNGHDDVFVPKTGLKYTAAVSYNPYDGNSGPFGFAAFGVATPASGVPTTGSASYGATIEGGTVDGNAAIVGTVALNFNFGTGTLSGSMNPNYWPYAGIGENYSLGTYTFANTVYSNGSTTFSGQLVNSNVSGTGSFEGMFTGPNAQELMSTFSAPFVFNGSTGSMFGVWVGKRD